VRLFQAESSKFWRREGARRDPGRRLCRGYAKGLTSASISYAGLRIFSV
jgi:hypothetical protein